jgi:hypothetical protein
MSVEISITVEPSPGYLAERLERLALNVTPGRGGALDDSVAGVTARLADIAADLAPYDTGALSRSHAWAIEGGQGRVYLDPAAINWQSGGRPVEYGPIVHEQQPWLEWTMVQAPAILAEEGRSLVANLAEGLL